MIQRFFRVSRGVASLFITALWLFLLSANTLSAQNVTISPATGKLIAGLTKEGEVAFQQGGSSLWRHEQLPLTMLLSDDPDLTASGQLKIPAGDISVDETQGMYVITGGKITSTHINISLPKGYRFTGYKLIFLNNLNGKEYMGTMYSAQNKTIYETDGSFNTSAPKTTPVKLGSTDSNEDFVIERTSTAENDMGNNLYFYIDHDDKYNFFAVTLKYCELYFTAEGAFSSAVVPTKIASESVNMIGAPFATSRVDIGEIKPNTKAGQTFYSYHYKNVKDLYASNILYQEDAVNTDGKLPATPGNGSIQALQNDGKLYYAVGNNTYYVETPTEATTQNGIIIPLGYRITKAKINYHYGTKSEDNTNPAFTPSPYTLTVYSTDKNKPYKTVEVKEGEGSIELTNLNNDAVKFNVSGLEDNTKALITVELTLEALNPFVNSIDVVCHSRVPDGPELMQQFTNHDFQVSGGKFVFYVPKEFIDNSGEQKCHFTFENLYSKYGDETYQQTDPRHARYFFVKSKYYNDTNGKQHSTTGNEQASTKITTSSCGNHAFKYNNIDKLDNKNTSTTTSYLEEYPYSDNFYKEQGGTFTDNIEIDVNGEKKCYLFTGDETRWNIAPTTGIEHRSYAYYLMNMRLEIKEYLVRCDLKKIYEHTCYNLDGKDADKAMYGGAFKTIDNITKEDLPSDSAYITISMMQKALAEALEKVGTDVTSKQVLYLDCSNMYSVYLPKDVDIRQLTQQLNPNCLFYFPKRTSCNVNNFVQKTASGDYRACKNIVITDKQPFYAPYKITVPAENYVSYTRLITVPANGKVANATVMLPFALKLENGVHTNATNDECKFTLRKMDNTNCLALDENERNTAKNFYAKAKFTPVAGAEYSKPNEPYFVTVENAPVGDNKASFIATQYGADITATTAMNDDYTFDGETATGKLGSSSFTFKNHASYAGHQFKAHESQVFYFAKNMFLYCQNLRPSHEWLYVYPFRGYYNVQGQSNGAKLMAFNPVFDWNFDDTTGINELTDKPDLAVVTGEKNLTIMAQTDTTVQIYASNGTIVKRLKVSKGEQRTVSLPNGFYVVNGTKIVVR
ncbi:hypothetical protein [Hoylesella buccalis]|uniref:hypothetical protein n=1 Tax=Hoylesella buccalis TaxID=28127 RepID=UPI0026F065C5|nr:hypothetical protein [Hoylesella buccalis]